MIFTYKVKILESHLDTFGHVNHATFLQLFEEARWDWVTENGYGLDTVEETQLGPVILEAQIKYRKEIRLRETIQIETECTGYRSRVGTVIQTMKNEKGQMCAEAIFTSGLMDLRSRRLVRPTPQWLLALGLSSPGIEKGIES